MTTQWDGIEEFLAVAECQSFTEAAQRLNVSLSLVSRRISQLENRLGTPLLARTTRTVKLTPAGREYMLACRRIVEGLHQANAAISEDELVPRGQVRVGAIRGFTADIAAIATSRLVREHPAISVDLSVYSRDFDLRSEDLDVAISNSAAPNGSLTSLLVSQRAFCMAASPEYIEKHGEPKTPNALADHKCILSNEPFWLLRYGEETRPLMLSASMRIHNHIEGLILAALQGNGIVYFSEYYLRPFIESGALKPLLEDHWMTDQGTWAIHSFGDHPPRRVSALLDILTGDLRDPVTDLWLSKLSREL